MLTIKTLRLALQVGERWNSFGLPYDKVAEAQINKVVLERNILLVRRIKNVIAVDIIGPDCKDYKAFSRVFKRHAK